jgi:hypothetical protein
MIRNEHLKSCLTIIPVLAWMYTMCLMIGAYPAVWKDCLLSLIPKGKGDLRVPTSWRGISLKNTQGKLLSALVADRLYEFMDKCGLLPDDQHGFVRGRSTESAFAELKRCVQERAKGGKGVYACFIDFRAAFDTASRKKIIGRLSEYGIKGPFLTLLRNMLGKNKITIRDGQTLGESFHQYTGLPQGDSLSGLLFVVIMGVISEALRGAASLARAIFYADDVVIIGRTIEELQEAVNVLCTKALECGLEINIEKTKAMKFRKGGRLARSDELFIENQKIPFVGGFSYLGYWITPSLSSFGEHIKIRKVKSIAAIWTLPDLRKLSIKTAMQLFDLKIAPCAAYGIKEIWEKLSVANMLDMERVKSHYIKRALGVAKNARNRLAYLLTGESTMLERLVKIFGLRRTDAYEAFLETWERKFAEIDAEFLQTEAMKDERWKRPLYERRHVICREAIHGFHHVFCQQETFHVVNENCICKFCEERCEQYHMTRCTESPYSTMEDAAGEAIQADA